MAAFLTQVDSDALFGLFAGIFALSVFSAIVIILTVVINIALIMLGIILLSKANRRKQDLAKVEHAAYCTATVADMRFSYTHTANGMMMNQYEIALQFTGTDGLGHRAFLGIQTPQVLNLTVGSQTPIAVLPQPAIRPSVQAFDPARGADGKLPPVIDFCRYFELPIDETGTVMLTADHQKAVGAAGGKIRTQTIVGWVLIGIFTMRLLVLLASFVM